MSKELSTIRVTKYRDDLGRPTCALNFKTGDVCEFFRTQRFGTIDTCLFAEQQYKYRESQLRYNNGNGHTIPLNNCPIWNGHDNDTRVE
jgi:hypothetical protein